MDGRNTISNKQSAISNQRRAVGVTLSMSNGRRAAGVTLSMSKGRSVGILLIALCLFTSLATHAQTGPHVQPMQYRHYSYTGQVNIGNSILKITNPSAFLELGDSLNSKKGLLLPRGYTDSISSPAKGLVIYDLRGNKIKWYNGSFWDSVATGGGIGGPFMELADTAAMLVNYRHWLANYQTKANLSTNVLLGASNTLYPSQLAVKTYVDNQLAGIGSGTFVPNTRTLTAGTWINNTLGDLSTNRTIGIDTATLFNQTTGALRRKDSLTSTNLKGYVTRTVLKDSMAIWRAGSGILGQPTITYGLLATTLDFPRTGLSTLALDLIGGNPTSSSNVPYYNGSNLAWNSGLAIRASNVVTSGTDTLATKAYARSVGGGSTPGLNSVLGVGNTSSASITLSNSIWAQNFISLQSGTTYANFGYQSIGSGGAGGIAIKDSGSANNAVIYAKGFSAEHYFKLRPGNTTTDTIATLKDLIGFTGGSSFTEADVRATDLAGFSSVSPSTVLSTDNVLQAIEKLQAQLDDPFIVDEDYFAGSGTSGDPLTFIGSSGTTSLTSTRLAIGSVSNTVTSDANLNFDAGTLAVGGVGQENTTAGQPEYLQELIINEPERAGLKIIGYLHGSGTWFGPTIHFYAAEGTPSSPTAIHSGRVIQSFGMRAFDGTIMSYSEAAIITEATQDWDANSHGTRIYFQVQKNDGDYLSSGGRKTALILNNTGHADFTPNLSYVPYRTTGMVNIDKSSTGNATDGFGLVLQNNADIGGGILLGQNTTYEAYIQRYGSAVSGTFEGALNVANTLNIQNGPTNNFPIRLGASGVYISSLSDLGAGGRPVFADEEGKLYIGSGGGSSQWDDVTGGINYAGGLVGINTTTPLSGLYTSQTYGLDINAVNTVIGSNDDEAGGRTNSTGKLSRFLLKHYTNSEEAIATMIAGSNSTDNFIFWGGAATNYNAATYQSFYTTSSLTVLQGTEKMRISDGVYINTSSNQYKLPTNRGTDNYVLTTDGAGGTAWEAASGGGGSGDMSTSAVNTMTSGGYIVMPTNSSTSNFRVGSFEVQSLGVTASFLFQNAYKDGSDYKYRANGAAGFVFLGAGSWGFYNAPSGTAFDNATMTARLTIGADGLIFIGNTPTYADNTAALSGGLTAGNVYRTSTGVLMIVY